MIKFLDFHNIASSDIVNVSSFLISVIDFLMSPAIDTTHDGVAGLFFFFQTVPNSWSNCVGIDISLTDTPMHSFMGGVIVHTALPYPLPMPWLLMFLVFFVVVFIVVAWLEVK